MTRAKCCLWLATALVGVPAAAEAACRVQIIAELPITMVAQKPLVPVKINGRDALMIVDSGAAASGFTADGAAGLGVPSAPIRGGLQLRTFGASAPLTVGSVKDFQLAGAIYHDVQVLVGGGIANVGAAGRLGQNVLGGEDTEYDLGGGAVRMLRAQDCTGPAVAYWAKGQNVASVAIEHLATARQIRGPVTVNGVTVQALFDTGSPVTYLDRTVAMRAGVDLTSADVKKGPPVRGVAGGEGLPQVITKARDLAIGGDHTERAPVHIVDLPPPSPQMLIGLDFFMTHRVVVDSAHDRLYFTVSSPPSNPPTAQ